MRLSSDRPATVLPFSVNSTAFAAAAVPALAASTATGPPLLDFLWKVLDDRERWVRRRLSEAADRRVSHRLRQLLQQRLVPGRPLHELERLDRANAARRALAAGLLRKEFHKIARGIRRSVLNREDDDRCRSDETTVLMQRVEIERNVGHRRRQDSTRSAARQV